MTNGGALFQESPHKRFNPLTGEWILVSPHRTKRPWQGEENDPDAYNLPEHDDSCYLCPGNTRACGETNPDYEDVFVFTNDFSALLSLEATPQEREPAGDPEGLFVAEQETGICRVICYSPRHDLSLARMTPEQALNVVRVWRDEYESLGSRDDIGYVQIFENRGSQMGCSNPHPHGQIWASKTVPTFPAVEQRQQAAYLEEHERCLLCRYLEREEKDGSRILFSNASFVVLVPYWAVWPFETMILSRRHVASISELTDREQQDLAEIMVRLSVRYDNLFNTSFPYSMGLHQQPTDGRHHPEWHFHIHYYPPLLRSASVKKFMVGYEMMAMPQRDLTAEQSAARLRELSDIHFMKQRGNDGV